MISCNPKEKIVLQEPVKIPDMNDCTRNWFKGQLKQQSLSILPACVNNYLRELELAKRRQNVKVKFKP